METTFLWVVAEEWGAGAAQISDDRIPSGPDVLQVILTGYDLPITVGIQKPSGKI